MAAGDTNSGSGPSSRRLEGLTVGRPHDGQHIHLTFDGPSLQPGAPFELYVITSEDEEFSVTAFERLEQQP